MPIEEIKWDKHDVVDCDERGRATLGSEYAGERVFVYVSELPDAKELPLERETPEEIRKTLTRMLSWARENDIDTMTHLLDPHSGEVTDKHGETHQSPYSVEDSSADKSPQTET